MAVQNLGSQPLISTDCLTPNDVATKTVGIGKTKCTSNFRKCFILSMFAGAFIGFGAMYYLFITSDTALPYSISKLLGGLAFCLGLQLVLIAGAELFTGNTLAIQARLSHEISTSQLLKNWVIVWLGNLMGSLVLVVLLHLCNFGGFHDHAIAINMANVAAAKIHQPWLMIFVKAIVCNILVCLAVWMAFAARSVADKIIAVILPISAFVCCGFEHSVANMFFLPMGYVASHFGGIPAHQAAWDFISMSGIMYNLSAATLGNIVGGAFFVGFAYWLAFKKPAQNQPSV